MTELKLVEDTKPLDWRKERIGYFLTVHLNVTGRKCPLGYGALMGMMSNLWVKHHGYENEDGDVDFDIPDMETWKEQVDGFFRDEWARDNMNYHFGFFIKTYGKYTVEKKKSASTNDAMKLWKEKMGRK